MSAYAALRAFREGGATGRNESVALNRLHPVQSHRLTGRNWATDPRAPVELSVAVLHLQL